MNYERIDSENRLGVIGAEEDFSVKILLQVQGENILVSPGFKESRIQ